MNRNKLTNGNYMKYIGISRMNRIQIRITNDENQDIIVKDKIK